MITELRAQNFKSWKDTGDLRFAPLTGFFGANSSGKTSILQVLLMLKQTVEHPSKRHSHDEEPLYFGNASSLVNLGSFDDIIHQHSQDLTLDVSASWKSSKKIKINEGLADSVSFATSIRNQSGHPVLQAYCYSVNGQEWRLKNDGRVYTFKFPEFLVKTGNPAYSEDPMWSYPYRFYAVDAPDNRHSTLLPIIASFENLFNRISYLGPLRDNPRPHYNWRGKPPEGVGRHGEEMVSALFSSRIQSLDLDEHIPKWLQSLGLIDSYRVAPVRRTQRDYEFLVTQHKGGPEVRLTDVGFGVSQVLPVLILCYYAPKGSILILEQPEAHLHPKVQSELGDVLIDVMKNRNLQIILESHSEHLLHRLMLRTAETKLSVEDTALYFCQINEGVSEIEPLQVDEYGNIANWPQEFFGDVTGDLIKQGRAEMDRRGISKS
jgi:predicted ATPase